MCGRPRPSPSRQTACFRPKPSWQPRSRLLFHGHSGWTNPRSSDLLGGDLPQILSHEDQPWRPPGSGVSKAKGAILDEQCVPVCPSDAFSFHEGWEVPVEGIRSVLGLPMPRWFNVMWSWGLDACTMAPGQRGVQRQSCSVCHPPLIKCYRGLQGQGHTLCVS